MIHKEFRVIMDMKLGSLLVRGKSFKEEEENSVKSPVLQDGLKARQQMATMLAD